MAPPWALQSKLEGRRLTAKPSMQWAPAPSREDAAACTSVEDEEVRDEPYGVSTVGQRNHD